MASRFSDIFSSENSDQDGVRVLRNRIALCEVDQGWSDRINVRIMFWISVSRRAMRGASRLFLVVKTPNARVKQRTPWPRARARLRA